MATRVVINPAALNAFFQSDPGAQAGLAATSEAVKAGVVQAGPYGRSLSWPKRIPGERWVRRPMKHGRFKASIEARRFRHYYRVVSTDPFAHLIEWGSINNPAYAPFRRTLRRFKGVEKVKASDGG
jgi:hypothetical protein